MRTMTHAEALAFVGASPARTAKVATVAADGAPRVAPVWVAADGEDIVFNTGVASAKAKALRRDPRISLCFDDETPPFAFVIVQGVATISDDIDEVARWAATIGGRYMGADRAEEYGRRNGVPGELLVRVTPTKILSALDMAG